MFLKTVFLIFAVLLQVSPVMAQETSSFEWPKGKKMALSLSFDDGWPSQVDNGTPLLDRYGVKATFYVLPGRVKDRLEDWKHAVAQGHEIGNHTRLHPCTENFDWVTPDNAIENYTIARMKAELVEANQDIERLLGVPPKSFAYTCGGTTVGRGATSKSYIPVVSELFASGRGWLGEASNNPRKVSLSHVLGIKMDDTDFDSILPIIEEARAKGHWLVLAGHNVGQNGAYTTRPEMLEKLMAYVQDPRNGIWVAPVGTISAYIIENR